MKERNLPKRQKKKPVGVFGEKKKLNRYRRRWAVAFLLGGEEWANKMVGPRK